GRWLDPVADRLSLLVVAVTFVATGIAPLWLALAIAIPDVVLAAVCLWLFGGSPDLPVTVLGKVRTALLLVGKARGLRADGQDPREGPSRRG
ncbi:CDP-alcohol phosphatidyltransferase family protein, partial [Micrococcus luteus]